MDARWPVEIYGIEPIAHLGVGGFGQVWLANQTDLDRKVAVKISHIPFTTDDDKRRFERECKALGQLGGHPHIIEVHTSGVSNNLPYLVLQYVNGGTLADHGQSLTETELRAVNDQLCQAVSAAHARGVLHRDLKPENVFLQQDRTVILGDFGIARLGDGNNTAAAGVTGSMAFVAPEVLQGHPPSAQADVYGIGITIISAVLGTSPFLPPGTTNIHAIISNVIEAQTPDLTNSSLTAVYQNLLLRSIHPDPDQRPQTVDQLRAELNRLPPAAAIQQSSSGAGAQQAGGVYPVSGYQPIQSQGPTSPMGPQSQPLPAGSVPAGSSAAPTPFAVTNPSVVASTGAKSGLTQTMAMAAIGVGSLLVLGVLFAMLINRGDPETIALGSESDSSLPAVEESVPTEETVESESTTTTEPTTTTTEPPLPLALPLNGPTISRLTDVPLDPEGLDPLLGAANNAEFCNDVPDITGMTETLAAIYPANATEESSFRQVAQRLHRFSTPEQASTFIATYTELSCNSWQDAELTTAGVADLEASVYPSNVIYGDETVSIQLVTKLPGTLGVRPELHSRTTLVRSGSDVYKLFYISLSRTDVNQAVGTLLPNAIDRLGY